MVAGEDPHADAQVEQRAQRLRSVRVQPGRGLRVGQSARAGVELP
jgi:hypothetical protein